MPTREDILSKLDPDKRKAAEDYLKLEDSTFTTPDIIDQKTLTFERETEAFLALTGQHIPEESLDVLKRMRASAVLVTGVIRDEMGEAPSTGEMCTMMMYLVTLIGSAALSHEQQAMFLKGLQHAMSNITVLALTGSLASAFNPESPHPLH